VIARVRPRRLRAISLRTIRGPSRAAPLEIHVSRSNFAFPALALAATLLTGCHDIPKSPGSAVHASDAQRLRSESPIEVAVAPIVNAAGTNVPTDDLRLSFQKGLVDCRYSPLALEYVDRKVVDAAYTPGAAQENATLRITVEKWDTSLWSTHGAITARITVNMIDANGSGDVLWSATADQRFDFKQVREQIATEGGRVRFACDSIAAEILARLPARQAVPGRATAN
jgi:hypothetical protein